MDIDDGQLIEIVRQFSVLYDKSHKDYRNNEQKSNAWKTIGDIMDHSAAECETRWTTLRNIFTRESKKDKVVPSGSGGKVKPWLWLEQMRWLADFVRRRKTKGNVPKPESEVMEFQSQENVWDTMTEIFRESEEVVPIEEREADENEDPLEVESVSELETENIPAKNRKSTNDDHSSPSTPARKSSLPTISKLRNERHERKKNSQQSALLETMNSAWGKFDDVIKQSSQNENHPDILFGKMVGAELGSIEDINIKFTVKQAIIKILHEANIQ